MSRIQQVLQKAEQEGTARRTRGLTESAPRPVRPSVLIGPDPGLPASVQVVDRTTPALPPPESSRTESEVQPHPLLVATTAPHSPAAERYRSLRTRIAQVEHGTLRRVLMMTSPGRGEGKSMTTLNLGITMAQEFHRRVLVIDADLRRPSLHTLLGLPLGPGLSDVLLGAMPLEEALITIPDFNLAVVTAGLPTERPTELLGSTAMRRLLEVLRSQFDRVLIDTPPASPLADAGVLARMVDGIVVIVRAGKTHKQAVEQTLAEIDAQKVLGLVLNDAGGPETAAYAMSYAQDRAPEALSRHERRAAAKASASER